MLPVLDKMTAIRAYAFARQAERSIDFSLHGNGQWELLRQYYSAEKRQAIRQIADQLLMLLPANASLRTRESFGRFDLFSLLLRPVSVFLNQRKRHWRFHADEVCFIASSFSALLENLAQSCPPNAPCIVDLRMDFHLCQHIIADRLYGLMELKQADNVEHFCQSEYVRYFSLEELGVAEPQRSAENQALRSSV